MTKPATIIAPNKITPFLHLMRGGRVILDTDLAKLFGVETRTLNQTVKRNLEHFPRGSTFELDRKVILDLSRNVMSLENLKFSSNVRAFTEQGAVMTSALMNNIKAAKSGPSLVRAFIQLEQKRKRPSKLRINRWNYSRIDSIHELIYNGTYPTIAVLMKKVKASKRSVLRDLRYIDSHKELPLAYSRTLGRKGYYYSGPVPKKLIHTFTETEILQHFIATSSISQVPVKAKQRRMGLNMDDLGDLVDDRTRKMLDELDGTMYFRPFAPEQIDVNTFYSLHEAVRKKLVIEFDYLKHMALLPERKHVAPYCFTCAANSWYLIALDVSVNQMRTYMLSRLSEPAITTEKFKKPKDFSLDDYFDGAFIVMGGNESHDVVIEFDRWASAYIRNRQFTRDQKIEEQPHGGLRISFHVKNLEEVEAWVCYWRQHATVISPRPLQERLLSYGQFLTKTYGPLVTSGEVSGARV